MPRAMYKIGSWQFDPETATLRRGDHETSLEDRAARVLDMLCRRRGTVVSKHALLHDVWQGRSVSPNSVSIVIGDLRRALGDDPGDARLIMTVGKRGYRLAADDIAPALRLRHRLLPLAFVTILLLGVIVTIGSSARHAPIELVVLPTRNETGRAGYDDLARALTAVVTDRATRFRHVRLLAPGLSAPPHGRRIALDSRLILWNGAPELAITATDSATRTILWSTFATGRSGNLARDAAAKLDALPARLARTSP